MSDIILPTKKSPATRKNPKTLILYGKPKVGKTTILKELDNCLIIDLEDGSDFVEALKYKVNNLKELHDLGEKIKEQGKPYKYIAIDTITKLEEWCEEAATTSYKKKPIGKNFTGKTVLELPKGAGYLHLRIAYKTWISYIETLADNLIFVGHVKDSVIDKSGTEVTVSDVDLTGKLKAITCQNADAIGYIYRKEDKPFVRFKHNGELEAGGRCEHLIDQEFEFDWSKIYV